MKKSILIPLFYLAFCIGQPLFAQSTTHTDTPSKISSEQGVLEQQSLTNNFGTSWTPLLFQHIPGLTADLSYRQQGSPLVVVDGIPMPFFDLNELNSPSFINAPHQKITFLASTEAIAQYGILGQNGAILISSAKQPSRKGWYGGASSGFVYKAKPAKNDLSEGYYLSEQVYLAKNTKKLSTLFSYQNQWVSKPTLEIISGNNRLGQTKHIENSPKNWLNHSLKAQVSAPVTSYISTQISGTYNETDANDQWNNLRAAVNVEPGDRFSIQMKAGLANAQTYRSFSTVMETIQRSNPYGYETESSNVDTFESKQSEKNQRAYKEAGIKMQYRQPITSELELAIQTEFTFFDRQTDDKKVVESYSNTTNDITDSVHYTFQQQTYRSFSYVELSYNQWINARVGMHGQTTQFIEETTPFRVNPYVSVESRLASAIGQTAVSTLNFGASYSSLSPSALQQGLTSTTAPVTLFTKNAFQARLESGFLDDRYEFQLTYFNEQQTNNEYITAVPVNPVTGYSNVQINTGSLVDDFFGWEASAKAAIFATADLKWSIGLQSQFLSKKNYVEFDENIVHVDVKLGDPYTVNSDGEIITIDSTPIVANDTETPSDWHKNVVLSSQLSWKGFEFSASAGYQSYEVQLYTSNPYSNPTNRGTFYVEPVNKWMLHQLQLHYHLPESLLKGKKIKKAGIGLFAQNVSLNPGDQAFYFEDFAIPGYEQFYGGLWGVNLNLHF